MQAWKVYLHGYHIDTVWYDSDIDSDRVKQGLINHDGYDSDIVIFKD